jgi:hypothetical protein
LYQDKSIDSRYYEILLNVYKKRVLVATYSNFIKNLYRLPIVGYLLVIILPIIIEKEFQKVDGEVSVTSSETLFLFSSGFGGGLGFIAITFLLFAALFSFVHYRKFVRHGFTTKEYKEAYEAQEMEITDEIKAKKEEKESRIKRKLLAPARFVKRVVVATARYLVRNSSKVSMIMGILVYLLIDLQRGEMVNIAFENEAVFGNVAPYSVGLYMLLFSISLNFILPRLRTTLTYRETKAWIFELPRKLRIYSFGPTFIQYASIHVTALVMMMFTYGRHAGYSKFYEGPQYYTEMILSYGMNRDAELPKLVTWLPVTFLVAPMFVLLFGVVFFIVKNAGFAPNGPAIYEIAPDTGFYKDRPPGVVDYRGFDIYGFFSMDVPGANSNIDSHLFGNPKLSDFYVLVVFGSIIIGAIIASLINFKFFENTKQPRYFAHLRVQTTSAWFVAWTFASMTGVTFVLPFGIIASMLGDGRTNFFIRHKWTSSTVGIETLDVGMYHPLTIFYIIMLTWQLILVLIISINYLITNFLKGDFRKAKESKAIKGKFMDEAISDIPFTKNDI